MPAVRRVPTAGRLTGLPAELLAEFFGTMIILLFGDAVVAQVVTGGAGLGDHNSIAWVWGFGVTFGVYVAGKVSGAHLNPAITLALAVYQGFSWRKVAPYVAAQFLGAFTAALIIRWNYSKLIDVIDPHHTTKTQVIFSTLPGNGTLPVSQAAALRDQIIGTAILLFLVMAISSVKATPPMANLAPVVIGLVVVAIGMAWGTLDGYAINPARDFGPRLASFITGYAGAMRDQHGHLFFWVPIVGPLLGALVGGGLFALFYDRALPDPDSDDEPQEQGRLPQEDASR